MEPSAATSEERGIGVAAMPDGGIAVIGETASEGAGGWDLWVMKLNAAGDSLWEHALSGAGDEDR